ncbi:MULTISPECIES: helix-turn-helix transcriptional regulator [unclassified Moraxella]|uniref:helix-turn-helix transcriptional regulator n=1 Tax=unclassified Moraxella TaxID=2685852 RepID=UPI003AF52E0F
MNTINTTNPTFATIIIPQLISIQDVIQCTGLSRATIYRMIDEKSEHYDPTFPKKVQLSQVRIAWVASEVAEWINQKIASRSA